MINTNEENDILEFMNNNLDYDLYNNNTFLEDFQDLNNCLDCKYQSENSFINLYTNKHELLFLSINAQSLASKFSSLHSFLDNLSCKNIFPNIFAIQEVWKIEKEFYNINGYDLFCNLRKSGQGGGAALYIKQEYNSSYLEKESIFIEKIIETVVVKIDIPNVKKFICVSLYRPNTHNTMTQSQQLEAFFVHLNNLLQKLDKYKLPVYILTDINIDLMKLDSNFNARNLHETLLSYGFFQLIGKCTRISNDSKTLIDHIYCNEPINHMKSGVIIDSFSDHYITYCSISDKKYKSKNSSDFFYRRNFSDHNLNTFSNYVSCFTWNNVLTSTDTDEAFDTFMDDFNNIFELSFPKKKIKVNKNKQPLNKFMTKGLMISRKTKLKLGRKANLSQERKDLFRTYRNIYNSVLKKSKAIYFRDRMENANGDSKKVWDTIREACNTQSSKSSTIDKLEVDGIILNDHEQIANAFNSHFANIGNKVAEHIPDIDVDFKDFLPPPCVNSFFLEPTTPNEVLGVILSMGKKNSQDINDIPFKVIQHVALDLINPLSHIFNLSVDNGIFPTKMKTSKVIPIFKGKGSKLDLDKHRGVAIVNTFSKVFEKLAASRLIKFLNKHKFFDENQFGFLKGRSTNHAIVRIINFVTNAINKGEYAVGIFLDAMKAFDSVNHSILLKKLENAGIRGSALDWFKSFLSGRNQRVKIGEFLSMSEDINISVLQGSVLGVILFVIFINDLKYCSDLALVVLFADDNNTLVSHSNIDELNRIANNVLSDINRWYAANKLALHPDKSKFILFKPKFDKSLTNFPLFIDFNNADEFNLTKVKMIKSIPNSDEKSIRVLGVLLDQELSLSEHVKSLHSKLSRSLYSLKQISNLFSKSILKLVFNATIQSHLNYCSNILSMCNKGTIEPIIKLQKKAIRVVCKSHYNAHTAPLFKDLDILPIDLQIKYTSISFMHDFTQSKLSCSFDQTWMKNNVVNEHYNLRNGDDYFIGRHRYAYLTTHPLFNFPSLWNELDESIKIIESKDEFLKALKSNLLDNL